MPVGEYVKRVTHREHLVHLAHLEAGWDTATKLEQYLMQIAAEVRSGNIRRAVEVMSMKLKFGPVRAAPKDQRDLWFKGVGYRG